MDKLPIAKLVKTFAVTYVCVLAGFSYFALHPAFGTNDWVTLLTTAYQMILLAAITSVYAMAIVLGDSDEATGMPA